MEMYKKLKYRHLKQAPRNSYFKRGNPEIDLFTFSLDQSDEIILIVDKNTNIIFPNKKACVTLGYSPEELLSMTINDIAPNFEEEFQAQSPLNWSQSKDSMTIDMYYKIKDRRTFPVEVKISSYRSSEEYFFFVAKDMSNGRQVYDMLWHSEQEFVTLVENSPSIIVRYDLQNRCVYVNASCERITGYSWFVMAGNVLGQTRLLPEDQLFLMRNNLCLVKESGLPLEFDLTLPHANTGLPVHLQVTVVPEFNTVQKVTGVIAVAYDISDLKNKEEELIVAKYKAEESSRMKSFFLASISHEIRTPLNAIVGLTDMLKDEALEPNERDEFISLIDKSGMKLVNMIEEILELAKIESGQIEIMNESYIADTIMKDQYLTIREMLKEKKKDEIGVQYLDVDSCGKKLFFGDTKHIRQVLNILAGNAVKFTHKGAITLGIHCLTPGQLTFYISDTGIGIPEGKQKSIFEPFVQVDSSLRRAYDGLGIGLSLAQRIAKALGGDITLISKPDEGTTFYFSLPVSYPLGNTKSVNG
ncbi:MAG: PAS domain S-box protein [Prolixibacteraceae bacterium]|nr:PAS domain S-box protein [Prolixibacteraceae bacterium]